MRVFLGTEEKKKKEHSINFQLSILMEKMRKLKLWFIFQSVILGLAIALRGFRGRNREIMCSVFKEEGGLRTRACAAHLSRRLTDHKQIASCFGFGFNFVLLAGSLQQLGSIPSPPIPPASLKVGLSITKKCLSLKGKCNKMCLRALSQKN